MDPTIRNRWRQELVSTEDWRQHIDLALPVDEGDARGFLVRSEQTGLIGYLKPLYPDLDIPSLAAYEKIAADLAYEVGLKVPPAVLYRLPDRPSPQSKETAISLVPNRFGRCRDIFDLDLRDGGLSGGDLDDARRVLAESSGVLAFDAWLQDRDRHTAGNAVLAYDCGARPGTMLFLDHSRTMDYRRQWTQDRQFFGTGAIRTFFEACIDRGRVRAAAERIAGLPEDVVADVVRRIPSDFLAADARERLAGWLVWRKQNLLPNWDRWYVGA